jgi:hypothetical protein
MDCTLSWDRVCTSHWHDKVNAAQEGRDIEVLDLFYIGICGLFFVACWGLTKACDKL